MAVVAALVDCCVADVTIEGAFLMGVVRRNVALSRCGLWMALEARRFVRGLESVRRFRAIAMKPFGFVAVRAGHSAFCVHVAWEAFDSAVGLVCNPSAMTSSTGDVLFGFAEELVAVNEPAICRSRLGHMASAACGVAAVAILAEGLFGSRMVGRKGFEPVFYALESIVDALCVITCHVGVARSARGFGIL